MLNSPRLTSSSHDGAAQPSDRETEGSKLSGLLLTIKQTDGMWVLSGALQ